MSTARDLLAMGAPLNDREVSRRNIALNANLMTCPLGHAPGAPALYACDIEFG
jgi:hypothetical protein